MSLGNTGRKNGFLLEEHSQLVFTFPRCRREPTARLAKREGPDSVDTKSDLPENQTAAMASA